MNHESNRVLLWCVSVYELLKCCLGARKFWVRRKSGLKHSGGAARSSEIRVLLFSRNFPKIILFYCHMKFVHWAERSFSLHLFLTLQVYYYGRIEHVRNSSILSKLCQITGLADARRPRKKRHQRACKPSGASHAARYAAALYYLYSSRLLASLYLTSPSHLRAFLCMQRARQHTRLMYYGRGVTRTSPRAGTNFSPASR